MLTRILEDRHRQGNPVRVGLVGAGFIGRGLALQLREVRGIELVAVASRSVDGARRALAAGGRPSPPVADSVEELDERIEAGEAVVATTPDAVCDLASVDVVVDATGCVETGARLAVRSFARGKHVVSTAEVGATLGPILQVHADRAGVVFTDTDGDQPGVIMNLHRQLCAGGYRTVLLGNIKGFLDRHSDPDTQRRWARRTGQDVRRVTSFSDGTKLALEMAVVANATGFGVSVRGMRGPRCSHVDEAARLFDADELLGGGRVDYVLGAAPAGGAFVLIHEADPEKRAYLEYLKLGAGPLHAFHVPFHLPHAATAWTIVRAAGMGLACVAPCGGPVCEVVTIAKRDLAAGELLDGIGGYSVYGLLEDAAVARRDRLLPIGLSDGCRLLRQVKRDEVVTRGDVEPPEGRASHRLRAEQDGYPFA